MLNKNREYSQYFILTINGVKPLKIVNRYIVPAIYNIIHQLYFNLKKILQKYYRPISL